MVTRRLNMVSKAFIAQCLPFVLLLVVTGCGGSGSITQPLPVLSVSVSISPGGAALSAAGTQQFRATVANTSNTSVTWTVAGGGTISSAGLYTAPSLIPSPATVSVTATSQTDSSKSATINVNLLPLTITIPEESVVLGAGEIHQFTATVARHPNTAATWSLSGCAGAACGTITASGLYTSPASIPSDAAITVTATSQADPTKLDTAAVYHKPIAVSIRPANVVIALGATLNFEAAVRYGVQNIGVTWSLAPGCTAEICGTLANATQTSVTYTAPVAVPNPTSVTLYAKSVEDTSKTAQARVSISDGALLKEGDYAFYYNGTEGEYPRTPTVGWIAVAGRFHADGHGNITDGIEDMNLASGVFQSVAFTGTYGVGADYRGNLTITNANGTSTFHMTVDPSGTRGQFIKFDALPENSPISGTGYFELQDKEAFSLSALAGPYAVGIYSWERPVAAVGRFSASETGKFSDGRMDVTEWVYDSSGYYTPASTPNLTLTGSIGSPSSSTGRGMGTITLTPSPPGGTDTFNFAYYIISAQKILLAQTNPRVSSSTPVLSGEMRRQNGSFSVASFNAPTIFSISGIAMWGDPTAAVGRMVPNGSGSMTGVIDQNDVGSWDDPALLNRDLFGSYSVESNGRSTITLQIPAKRTYLAYFFGQNQGFLLQFSGMPGLGRFKPQTVGAFRADDISETFLTNTMAGHFQQNTEKGSGITTFSVAGTVASSMDMTHYADLSHLEFTGTYTVAANGRGTISFDKPTNRAMVFWIISPTELVGIAGADPDLNNPVLIEFRR
jgi:hypothetical protein